MAEYSCIDAHIHKNKNKIAIFLKKRKLWDILWPHTHTHTPPPPITTTTTTKWESEEKMGNIWKVTTDKQVENKAVQR